MRLSAAWKAANPNHPHVKNPRRRRRPRPISSGPKRGRPSRQLTTSEAAIRRSRARRSVGPKPPTGRGPRRPSRTINTGPKRPKRTTSQAAIARFKAMRGRRRR